MTPNVEPDIQTTDTTHGGEIIHWRGMKDTGVRDGCLEFEVYQRRIEIMQGRQTSVAGPRLMVGSIKANGCTTIQFDKVHWCLLVEFQRHMQVLGHIYVRAWDLMGTMPPGDDEHGVATYAAAVAARTMRQAADAAGEGVRTIGVPR
jgi:hypothetical protein